MQMGLSFFQPVAADASFHAAAFLSSLVNGFPFLVAAFLYSQADRLLCFHVVD